MKVTKLPSGNWRIQYVVNGKRKSHTFDHNPTKKEINQLIYAQHMVEEEPKQADTTTFKEYAEKYISIKENVLSPSTIRIYNTTLNNLPENFTSMPLVDINQPAIQAVINELAAKIQPKTVRNYNGFIMSVINMYAPEKSFHITLPQKKKPDDYIPTPEEVKKVLEASSGTIWYICFVLGCYGLRRSEILPLTADDFSDGCVHITKTTVLNKNYSWVTKELGKTSDSLRSVPLPAELIKEIKKQNFKYEYHPNELLRKLHKYQKIAKVPQFRFHLLRHFFCTELSQAGYSESDIMSLGGWSSDYIFKKVYRHQRIMENKKAQKKLSEDLFKKIK